MTILSRLFLLLSFLPCYTAAAAQSPFKVLHYTETSAFDHQTRDVSLQMFQTLGQVYDFSVVHDTDGTAFNSVDTLLQYAVVVFSNTSGNAILDAAQRANFEAYIDSGGAYLGIHAASDTYRHSTANGNGTGTWDWYAELAGASVQTGPNHVSGTPLYAMHKVTPHPATAGLPDPWLKNEEYYYWENGYYNPENTILLEVEETVGPNGQVNSYDTIRPMAWYRELPNGSRVFYTALGHAQSNYTTDTLFRKLIRDALLWTAGRDTLTGASEIPAAVTMRVYPNPAHTTLQVEWTQPAGGTANIRITDLAGRQVFMRKRAVHAGKIQERINVRNWRSGFYLLELHSENSRTVCKVLVKTR